ncbi:ATP-binding cassette domain-containing protein [Flavivirga aquimarina]|uniref:ATP-binding cassette domain-containing protein n=1 Tax=Flavivirga aquimarina TaxID=2027862 RepID=A0ABT8WFI2_9FLAO|nr:ATP-binding cassette domain-containing protein [Flavivirga aquimarina]MDO5971901.1 ATP-binding cassette domain-containing protein [Flavivirga aquimarina]
MIKVEKLSKSYGRKKILSNISFELEEGKIYGLVGENGAGKTTLFKCLTGIEKYQGDVKSNLEKLKNSSGFLPSEPYFFKKTTGREYIQLLTNARKIVIDNIEDKNIFNLPLDQYASTYSTGMKKKLALMAILFQKNDFFILDEPFNGVDIEGNILIEKILQKLKELNKTVIISSHIFTTLKTVCDEIIILEKGNLTKHIKRTDYSKLEHKMKNFNMGNQLEKLGLT